MATYKDNIFCQTYQKLKMTSTAIHFATVALNTDPVPQPKELTVAQKYAILAEQGSNCQKIKAWVKKTIHSCTVTLRQMVGTRALSNLLIFDYGPAD